MKKQRARMRLAPCAGILLAILVLTDRTGLVLATLAAAFLHECGHILAARAMHIPFREMRVDLMGARLELGERMLSYGEEWLLAAAGPIASFLAAAFGAIFWQCLPISASFSCASLLLGLLNLLPIRSFDGGRMLESALTRRFGTELSYSIMNCCSFLFLFLLWACAVYFLLRAGDGISLFFFSLSLFLRFFEKERI